MNTITRVARLLFGVFLVLHGVAHMPGVLAAWKLATFEDTSYQPNVLLTEASDAVVYLLGAVWLVAVAGFVAAGAGAILRARWWFRASLVATLISLPMTVLWWQDAIVGLVINIVLIAILMATAAWNEQTTVRTRARASA